MSDGAIEFACPYCEKITRVPASFGGKQGKCPGCQRVIEVPDPNAGAAGAPTVQTPQPMKAEPIGAPVVASGVTGFTPPGAGADTPADGAMRPCPCCGEKILAAAKKCKFCGEFLDPSARAAARSPAALDPNVRLASLGSRFGGWAIDRLIEVPGSLLGAGGYFLLMMSIDPSFKRQGMTPPLPPAAAGLMIGLGLLALLAVAIYQWYLISTTGQTIGKKQLGIKIVKLDGSDVDFVTGVILRNWVMHFITQCVPYVGCLCVWPIDKLMIFGEERRCLHDQIASTRVIEV